MENATFSNEGASGYGRGSQLLLQENPEQGNRAPIVMQAQPVPVYIPESQNSNPQQQNPSVSCT